MEKKNNTKVILAESLRSLMQKMSFQSITIKKICDEAGVVRVTFYNYFVDKYDALDYLVQSDLADGIQVHSADPVRVLIEHLASMMMNHRRFYEVAVDIEGQNGFREIFIVQMKEALQKILQVHRKRNPEHADLSDAYLAETYAVMVFYFARTWLRTSGSTEQNFIRNALKMTRSSFYDFIDA